MRWDVDPTRSAGLAAQIVASVRRAVHDLDVEPGERLPPAAELAAQVGVDRNTVLAAYRRLRDDGVVEFRRGRGVRIVTAPPVDVELFAAVEHLVAVGRTRGLPPERLAELVAASGHREQERS